MDVLEYSLHQNFSFLKIHLQGFPKVCIYFNWKECKIRILLDYIFFFGGGGCKYNNNLYSWSLSLKN